MTTGGAVWLAIGILLATWLTVTFAAGPRNLPGALDVLRWFLRSWTGRLVALAAWAEIGWHLFTQRP